MNCVCLGNAAAAAILVVSASVPTSEQPSGKADQSRQRFHRRSTPGRPRPHLLDRNRLGERSRHESLPRLRRARQSNAEAAQMVRRSGYGPLDSRLGRVARLGRSSSQDGRNRPPVPGGTPHGKPHQPNHPATPNEPRPKARARCTLCLEIDLENQTLDHPLELRLRRRLASLHR